MCLRRIALVRHGETEGESSIRYHGAGDVALSALGLSQMRAAAAQVARGVEPDLVVASSLSRSWEAAWIVGAGRPVRIEADLREIDFGRWEGLTREEIQARDPILFEDWQAGVPGFDYPDGERRADFEGRIGAALERLLAAPVHHAVAVLHKGVIRQILGRLLGEPPPRPRPDLGEVMVVSRRAQPGAAWRLESI